MNNIIKSVQREFAKDFTTAGLKTAIVLWALIVIFTTLSINNKWVLAGILAYEVLP